MGRYVVLSFGLLFLLAAQSAQAEGWHRDINQAFRLAQTQGRPLVVFVTMDGCSYCHKMIETTLSDANVLATIGSHCVPAAIRRSEQPELMKRLKVRSFPTTLVFGADGKVIDQMTGYVPSDKFQQRLGQVLSQYRRLARR